MSDELDGAEVPAPKPESKLVRYLRDLAMALIGAALVYVQQNGLPF